MSTQPTVKEMQVIISTIRKFAEQDDYNLRRPYLKSMVIVCADLLDTVLQARNWEPVTTED